MWQNIPLLLESIVFSIQITWYSQENFHFLFYSIHDGRLFPVNIQYPPSFSVVQPQIIGWKKFRRQPKLEAVAGRVQFGCQRKILKPIISKLDEHVVLLFINCVASQLLGVAQSGYFAWLMTWDIFKLSRSVTLHFPLVENVQRSFCTLRGVVVLILASQVCKLPFWQRR